MLHFFFFLTLCMNKQKQHDALHLESLQTCRHTLAHTNADSRTRQPPHCMCTLTMDSGKQCSAGKRGNAVCDWDSFVSDVDERRKKKRGVVMSLFCLMSGATQTHVCSVCFVHWKRCSEALFVCKVGWTTHIRAHAHTRAHERTRLDPGRDAARPPKSPYHAGLYLRERGRHAHNTKPAAANELLLYTLMKYNCITVGK